MAWSKEEKDLSHCETLFTWAGLWLPGIVVAFGLLGTGLSLFGLVRIRRHMGPTPSLLMLTLSSLDMFVLLLHAIRIYCIENSWSSFAGENGNSRIPGLVVKRLTSTAYFCEAWLVVLIAFNRFISICRPLYHGRFNHPRTMRITIIILIIISIVVHLPEYFTIDGRYGPGSYTYHPANATNGGSSGSWSSGGSSGNTQLLAGNGSWAGSGSRLTTLKPAWTKSPGTTKSSSWSGTGNVDQNGMIKKKRNWWQEEENQWFKTYIMIVDRLFTIFIPCIVLIILESFMVVTLLASRKQRREMTQDTANSSDKTAIIILLSVAVSFVVINVPNQIYSIVYWKTGMQDSDECYTYRLVLNGTMILNSSINFILYYGMSAVFRRTLISSCRHIFHRGRSVDMRDGSSQEMMSPSGGKMVHKYKFDKNSTVSTKTTSSQV